MHTLICDLLMLFCAAGIQPMLQLGTTTHSCMPMLPTTVLWWWTQQLVLCKPYGPGTPTGKWKPWEPFLYSQWCSFHLYGTYPAGSHAYSSQGQGLMANCTLCQLGPTGA